MNLRDILKKQDCKVEKRTIKVRTEEGEKDCDVHIKVMSYSELEVLTKDGTAWTQVASTVLDEKSKPVFTEEQLKEIPLYIWMQLLELSNQVNGMEKQKP